MSNTQNGFEKKKNFDIDAISKYLLMAIASVTVLIILFIILFILSNSTKAISDIGLWNFITGDVWRPYNGTYGAASLIVGTFLVTVGAVAFAFPVGLGTAIYISEVASDRTRRILKPVIEIFAGIPSVVYGFFGLVVLVPLISDLFYGQTTSGFSWLSGSLLLGVMALPVIISVSDDALRAVPQSYREASLASGATKWETTRRIVIPAAISGISTAVILGIGRAMGETMAVMMVTGNTAIFPEPLWDIFSTLRTITATLALEMPEVVVGSTQYSALFLLALFLMFMVLVVNITANYIVRRTKRKFGSEEIKAGRISSMLSERVGRLVSPETWKKVKEYAITALIFVALFMIGSLFIGDVPAVILAITVTIGYKAVSDIVFKKMKRTSRQRIAHTSLAFVVIFVVSILVFMLGDIVIKGLPAISWSFLTEFPKNAGKEGGIFPAIVGTLELIAGAAIIALPLGILSGVYLAEYGRSESSSKRIIRGAVDILNGTPSVVFGLFGLAALVVYVGFGYSLIAGCITLALMILPVIIRTTEEAVKAVPQELREASRAMGATKWQTITRVVMPAAFGGMMTGVILSLGRAAGETAPIMFTAVVIMQTKLSDSIFEPVMALPYHLYYLATEGRADSSMMYGTALVLLIIVLSLFAIATIIRERSAKKNKW
jgi:phosphate transport system permease protein